MKNIFFGLTLILLVSSCQKTFFAEIPESTALNNFDYVWNDFKENYGSFQPRNINWDSLQVVWRGQLNGQSADSQLYAALVGLLSPLRDNHVQLLPDAHSGLPAWSNDLRPDGVYEVHDYSLEVVKKYAQDWQDKNETLSFGFLGNDKSIGYLNIKNMDGALKNYSKPLDQIFSDFNAVKGLVLDLRENAGGFDGISQYVAGRFAEKDTRKLYMTARRKNGPGPNDFSAPVEWYVAPIGDRQFTKPVIVLTTRFTASAAETGLLALRQLSNITTVGDTTSGAFSDAVLHEMPNGWLYALSVGDYRAADGKSYEGIGLAPNFLVLNQKAEILAGKDAALEFAIQKLK